ncbi:MAG: ABC transporter substrate-binding protein [Tissierellia bacterium]|nr:ABC transporter substrate-binding protein [Tissierellia bacterium]
MNHGKKLALLLALIMSLSFVFTACNSEKNKEAKDTKTITEDTVDTDKKENEKKVLKICTANELTNLTTLTMNKENNVACNLIYETLVSYEDGKIVPKLADSWEWQNDGKTLVFKLKDGVTFSDGETFNAEAVKKVLDFDHSNPNFAGIRGVAEIESTEVIDDHTIAIHYENPSMFYLNSFCFQNVLGIPSPKVFTEGNFETFSENVGTGPYVYEEFKSGDYTRFVKNENYHGEEPYYDEVIIKYIPDASSRLQALQKGEIDLIYGSDLISYDDFENASHMDGVTGVVNENISLTKNLILNPASNCLKDLKVRQGINYAINKKDIVDSLTYGNEEVAYSLFPKTTAYSDVSYEEDYHYDVDKAKELLDSAGWALNESTGIREKDGQALKLQYVYWPDLSLAKETALAIKTQLKEVGIDVETIEKDQMSWWTDGVKGDYDVTTWFTEGSYTEPHKFLQESITEMDPHLVPLQTLEDSNIYIDAIKKASVSVEEEEVKESIQKALKYSHDHAIDLPLSYAKDMILFRDDKVKGYEFTSAPQFFDISHVEPIK